MGNGKWKSFLTGRPHTFFHEEEAAAHCDAVGSGEGEFIWPLMLSRLPLPRTKADIASRVVNFSERGVMREVSMESFDLNCGRMGSERFVIDD